MTLNINKFATLISYISAKSGQVLSYYDTGEILQMVKDVNEVESTAPATPKASCAEVDELLNCMMFINTNGKIPAIKAYRVLTGAGLRESKEAVEKFTVTAYSSPQVPHQD